MRKALLAFALLTSAQASVRGDIITTPSQFHGIDPGNWSSQFRDHVFKSGVEAYSRTGHLPDTKAWEYLTWRRELNPQRFDSYHPRIAGLFKPAECVGELPETPYWAGLEKRYELNPARFTRNHPWLGPIMARNEEAERNCPPPQAVPEPSTLLTGGLGVLFLACLGWLRR